MIKVIIFDFGNVLCSFDNDIFTTKISKYTSKSIEEINDLIYNKSNLPVLYETGTISSDEFYEGVVKLCNLDISKEIFSEAYSKIFTPIDSTFELVRKLNKNYRLAVLSNISEWDFTFGLKLIEIFNLFEVASLSFEVKAMKPSTKIFEDCLEKLNLKPNECIYIDDVKKYSDKATELGMFGINYISEDKLLKSLKLLNIKL